jgi:regulator of replication initiation timing
MEEIQLDGQTLLSVYQSKVSSLLNENIMLEAKNLILTKKLTELSDKVSELESTKTTSRKKAVDTAKDAGTY